MKRKRKIRPPTTNLWLIPAKVWIDADIKAGRLLDDTFDTLDLDNLISNLKKGNLNYV